MDGPYATDESALLLEIHWSLKNYEFAFDFLHIFTNYFFELCTLDNFEVFRQIVKCKRLIYNRCGHVVRDFESEAKTRCNFQFR